MFLLLSLWLHFSINIAYAEKESILVLPCLMKETNTDDLSYLCSDTIRSNIIQQISPQEYLLYTRDSLFELLNRQNKDIGTILNTSSRLELGTKIGTTYLVSPSITQIENTWTLTCELFKVSDGTLENSVQIKSPSRIELIDKIPELTLQLLKKSTIQTITDTGYIVKDGMVFTIDPVQSNKSLLSVDEILWKQEQEKHIASQLKDIQETQSLQLQKQADIVWQRIEPYLGTPEQYELLDAFLQQFANVIIEIEFTNPITGTDDYKEISLLVKQIPQAKRIVLRLPYTETLIPSGTFTMGCSAKSTSQCESDELPRKKVSVSYGFWAMDSEVTQKLYTKVMRQNPSDRTHCGELCPVEQVSWIESLQFANTISEMEGFEACYTFSKDTVVLTDQCQGWRLASEEEWEYLAHHTQATPNSAWYKDNANNDLHPTCSKNKTKPCDILGNVSEWVWSEPNEKRTQIAKGGNWGTPQQVLRISYKSHADMNTRSYWVGIRLIRTHIE